MLLHLNNGDTRRFKAIATFAFLFVFVFAGCGPKPVPMGTVTGSVTAGSERIGNVKLAIYNVKTSEKIAATVDDAANYKITEIPFGDYEVYLYTKQVYSTEDIPPDPRIPKKYRSRKTSGLTVSIDSQDEVKFDIELE